ncbi:MAG: ABC transporter permease [Gemmatimonadota bacterium]|jgi:putative ABC transport system permease protein
MLDRIRGWWLALRKGAAPERANEELDEEVRLHIELETEELVRRGLTPEEARREAYRTFGGVERYKEQTRETRGLLWLDALGRHFRLSLRLLRKSPAFTAAAVVTLALGIGGTTAIFSVVDAVLMADSPFPEPERLVMVWETDRDSGTRHEPSSWPDVVDFRERSRALEAIATVSGIDATVSGEGEPEVVGALAVTTNLPEVLGVEPLLGRSFTEDDGASGPPFTVLLSEGFWRSHHGADPDVLGRTLRLNGAPATVVGVLPAAADLGFHQVQERADYAAPLSGNRVDLWVARRPTAEAFPRNTHPFLTLGRLAPGATLAEAQGELAGVAAELEEAFPVNNARGVNLEAYSDVVFGPVRPALLLLLGAVALVLLVACVNVANLLLARTTARAREVALRSALGARGADVRGQFLVEGLVLTGLGAALGVVLAYVGVDVLVGLAPAGIPRLEGAGVNAGALALAAGVTGIVGLIFGMVPWLQLRSGRHLRALAGAEGVRSSAGRTSVRLRAGLVVAEVALAVFLVVGAGLLLRSVWALTRVDPGFRAAGVLKAEYRLPAGRYPMDFQRWPDLPEITGFHQEVLREVRSLPGVEAAAVTSHHPLEPGFTNSFVIVGREAESADFAEIRTRFVTPGFLETLGIPLLGGRFLQEGDDLDAPNVLVLNRAAQERYFPTTDPVGHSLRFWGRSWRIVGVMGDVRFRGVESTAEPAVYGPIVQAPQPRVTILARTRAGDPTSLAPAIRDILRPLDAEVALSGVEALDATLSDSIAEPRFTALLLGLFAGIAIVLAVVGIHGVLAYNVARRSGEMGIRMALGASRADVVTGVVREGMALAALGVVLGLVGAFVSSTLLESQVFGVRVHDPATFGGVAGIVLAVALLASLLPAARATRADPVEALRAE